MPTYVHGGDIYTAQQRLGQQVLDFSANLNPLGMPPGVRQAAEQAIAASVCYPDPFCRELTVALAKQYQVPPAWLLCGNGAADLIFRFVLALKPKRALLLAPTFAEYQQALQTVNCQVEYYFLQPRQGFQLQQDMLDCLTEDLDVVFLCNPNNPTGQLIEPDLLQQIIEECRQQKIWLVVDECFQDFVDEPQLHSVVGQLASQPYLFVLKAFTKLYGMAGLRLGYGLCANERLMEQLYKVAQPWSVSVPAQAAGLQALQELEFVENSRRLLGEQRRYLLEVLKQMGLTVWRPQANYIFFQGPPGLAEQLQKFGVLIRKCGNYVGLDDSYYRIAVRRQEENQALLSALEKVLKQVAE